MNVGNTVRLFVALRPARLRLGTGGPTALAAPGQWRWLRLQWGPHPRPRGRPMAAKQEAWANMPTDDDDSGDGASVTIKRRAVGAAAGVV